MELLLLAGTWWIVGFSGAMMPGPVTTLIVTESARRGFWTGPLVTLGHVLVELAIVVGLFFGLGDVLKHAYLAAAIGLLGGLFLLWMGYGILRAAFTGQVSLDYRKESSRTAGNPVLAGVLTSISNPYMLLWWSTVGALWLITFRAFGLAGMVAFYFGHTLADWVWNCLVALLISTGRRFVGDRLYRGILMICGLFLLGLAAYFCASGVRFLVGLKS
jgi:threonine/homoserine/homoserine lactone efflux protein